MLILFSCEEGYLTDCSECKAGAPEDASLEILIGYPHHTVLNMVVTIYDGTIEDNIVIVRYNYGDLYADGDLYPERRVVVVLYKNYTATAEFTYNGQKYLTMAAICPKVRYEKNACDDPCYYVYDNILDLRLRYD